MPLGKIISILDKKRFGFLQSDSVDGDVFFHQSVVAGRFDSLAVGQQVEFELQDESTPARARRVIPRGRAERSVGPEKRDGPPARPATLWVCDEAESGKSPRLDLS